MSKKFEIHVVPHTHWDREWYYTFQEFRYLLVKLFDKLLNILKTDKRYKYFVFDGQTIVLEDYLEIRPEKRKEIEKYVKEGRLLVGPWYILPDEFLEGPESMIRNLIIGHRIARQFGKSMRAGYVPDPFGHLSQLPQILRGFDIDSFIYSRGAGEEVEKFGSEFIWQASDNSEVIAIFQVNNYCNAMNMIGFKPDGIDFELTMKRTKEVIELLSKYANTKYLLFNNGVDHMEPQPELPKAIEYLNKNLDNAKLIHSNFDLFVNKIRGEKKKLKKFKGEMRKSKVNDLWPGSISARMYLKQENIKTQNLLERYTEPITTFALSEGKPYRADFINLAWKYLIMSHPHDSMCGCSTDEVHRDVMRRFEWVQKISNVLLNENFKYLLSRINTEKKDIDKDAIPVVVYNPLNWERSEVVEYKLFYHINQKDKYENKKYVVMDEAGKLIPVTKQKDKIGFLMDRGEGYESKIEFLAENVSACGYKLFYVVPKENSYQLECKTTLKLIDLRTAENDFIKLSINDAGTIKVTDKINNVDYDNLITYEDGDDIGDGYNYSPSKNPNTILFDNDKAEVNVVEQNSAFIKFKISKNLMIPECITENREHRSEKAVSCPIETYLTIFFNSACLHIKTIILNNAKDHRFRVLFPTNINASQSLAETHFDIVKRDIVLPDGKDWYEAPSPTHPHLNFVSISDQTRGISILNSGLTEYEVIRKNDNPNQFSTVALTLMRCFGWLSQKDLPIRKRGWVGPPWIKTNESQSLGRQEFDYAILFHKADIEEEKIWKYAKNFAVPMLVKQTEIHKSELPNVLSFVEIKPDNLIISAIKKAEKDNGIIIRYYNTTGKKTKAKIVFYKNIKKAYLTNLNEEVKTKLTVKKNREIEIPTDPFKIVTVKLVI